MSASIHSSASSRNGSSRRYLSPRRRGPRVAVAMVVILLCLGGILYWVLGRQPLSDQEQILNVLEDIRAGTAKQNMPQIAQHLASTFQLEGLDKQQIKMEMMSFFRNHGSTSVTFSNPRFVSLSGDRATLEMVVDLSGSPSNGGAPTSLYHGTVQADFARQESRRFWIIPAHEWKITQGRAPDLNELAGL